MARGSGVRGAHGETTRVAPSVPESIPTLRARRRVDRITPARSRREWIARAPRNISPGVTNRSQTAPTAEIQDRRSNDRRSTVAPLTLAYRSRSLRARNPIGDRFARFHSIHPSPGPPDHEFRSNVLIRRTPFSTGRLTPTNPKRRKSNPNDRTLHYAILNRHGSRAWTRRRGRRGRVYYLRFRTGRGLSCSHPLRSRSSHLKERGLALHL